jgi:transglutaminase-like putative cysteine protease
VSAAAAPARRPEPDTLAVPAARATALLLLVTFGALHWMAMLEPTAGVRVWYSMLASALTIAGLLGAARLGPRLRPFAAAAVAVLALAAALLAGGVGGELIRPSGWGELLSGIDRGLTSLPGVRVPYRGFDEWTRTVITAGGTVLAVVATLVGFWPREHKLGFRHVALILLVTLYVVPAVALDFQGEFLRGAVLALLVLAYLRLETIGISDAGAAGVLAIGVVVLGMIAAPALDKDSPWWDYEAWALNTASAKSTSFSWDHTYGVLDWPRDGRELLRVRAQHAAYWKALNLDEFDGEHWVRGVGTPNLDGCDLDLDTNSQPTHPDWLQRIRVTIRNLNTRTFVTAGLACAVDDPRVRRVPLGDGVYATVDRQLRRGDAYTATVYTPQPTERERRAAGGGFSPYVQRFTQMTLPGPGRDPAGSAMTMQFPLWGSGLEPLGRPAREPVKDYLPARAKLEESPYGPVYDLAMQLKRGARTPEDFVGRIERYLGRGFAYTESPPADAQDLKGFLLEGKAGYCQQFSGAMALLLRMGGVPARVSTGFTTGSLDRRTGEYVVRDFDAHSWVEVYYPGIGWVTFDPTPAASPARSQPDDVTAGGITGATPRAPNFGGGDIRSDPSRRREVAGQGTPWTEIALAAAAAVLLIAVLALWLVRHRRRLAAGWGPLDDLELALHRARRDPRPGATLQSLEDAMSGAPGAAAFVRAVREARYSPRPAEPTPAQRRALRAELGRGGGLVGRLRAWWALPPRPR